MHVGSVRHYLAERIWTSLRRQNAFTKLLAADKSCFVKCL